MEQNSQQFDVVIVGGGMVGATMACLLAGLPLRVALVDRGELQSKPVSPEQAFDARVSALTPQSCALLERIGVWSDIETQRCCPYQSMHVWDAEGTGSITFDANDIDQPELGTIVENSAVLAALYGRLPEISNLTCFPGQSIARLESVTAPDGHRRAQLFTATGDRLEAELVIAADGANSPLRDMAGFRTREWDYNHQAIVTTVTTAKGHEFCARQRFLDSGPLAFLPLTSDTSEQQQCSIVWSLLPELAQEVMALDDEAFCKRLGAAFEWRLGEILACDSRFSFPLRQRHAIDYVKGSVVLIGDAAHTIHPLAGQGVNLGLLDAAALVQQLQQGIASRRGIADSKVLQRYQRARMGHNLGMMWVMEGLKHLFAEQALPIRWLRNVGLSTADSAAAVKNQLARRAMGL